MKTTNLPFVKKIGFLAIAAMITLSACQKKETTTTTPQATTGAYSQKGGTDDAENKANPFDYVGLAHNEGLHATRGTWTNKNSTFHDMYTDVGSFVKANYDPKVVPTPESNVQKMYSDIVADAPNLCSNLIAAASMSSSGKTYANQMMQTLLLPSSTATYADIKKAVVAQEGRIAADRSLSQSEKESLLQLGAVGRYSTLYWINESNGANSGTTLERSCTVSGPVQAQVQRFDWLQAVVADLGAIIKEIGAKHGIWVAVINVIIASAVAGFGLQ